MTARTEPEEHHQPLILVVDDDETTRMLAQAALSRAEFQVEEAVDGSSALAFLEHRRPDLIMLDVTMPGIDGFETCLRMREMEGLDALPILMMTGLDDVASIERAYAVGATDFATKPMNWVLVGYRLRYMLRASEAHSALSNAVDTIARGRRMLDEAERLARMGSFEWDPVSNGMQCSSGLSTLLGMAERDASQHTLDHLLERIASDDRVTVRDSMEQVLDSGEPCEGTYWVKKLDGAVRCMHHRVERISEGGQEAPKLSLRATLQDVTESRLAEEKIRRLAYVDGLTGLPNRESFKDRLNAEVGEARRSEGVLATLFLDLDDFKRINDTLGHAAGDQLLRHVAERLQESVRPGDVVGRASSSASSQGVVARLGGDEFTIVLTDLKDREDAGHVAERILELLASPVTVAGHEVVVSPSIGLAVYPDDGQDAQALLESADTAMYFAKRAGKNLYRFYDNSMSAAAMRRLAMENALRSAIDGDELAVFYQPQMDLTNGRMEAVEALLRWHNHELGNVSPMEFIPIAEETRLIIPIGEWVLRTACSQLVQWQERGVALQRVAVNISPVQFAQPEFVEGVKSALETSGLPARCLELEITESLLARDQETAVRTLGELKALGVQLSIDDFGTGYSSLSQLKLFPVDRLKIDRSFVRDITSDTDDAAIAMAVIGMAGSMHLNVVAEGVENQEQLEFLRDRHCDEIQGFLLSRPVAATEIETLLTTARSEPAVPSTEVNPVSESRRRAS